MTTAVTSNVPVVVAEPPKVSEAPKGLGESPKILDIPKILEVLKSSALIPKSKYLLALPPKAPKAPPAPKAQKSHRKSSKRITPPRIPLMFPAPDDPAFVRVLPKVGPIVQQVLGDGSILPFSFFYANGSLPVVRTHHFAADLEEGSFVVKDAGSYKVSLRLVSAPWPLLSHAAFPYIVNYELRVDDGSPEGLIVADLGSVTHLANGPVNLGKTVLTNAPLEAGQEIFLTYHKVNEASTPQVDATFHLWRVHLIIEKVVSSAPKVPTDKPQGEKI